MNVVLAIIATALAVPVVSYLAVRLPAVFVWLYLLVCTRFFGFLDVMLLSAEGVFNPLVTMYLGAVGATVLRLVQGRRVDGIAWLIVLVFCALFLYGLLYPSVLGDSDLAASFIDGKDMLAFGFFPYLLLHDSAGLRDTLVRAVRIVGFVLTAEVLAAAWLGVAPPALEPIEEALGVRHGIHVYNSMLIYLALVLHLYVDRDRWRAARIRWALVAGFFLLGLVMQGHRSLFFGFLMTAVGVAFLETTARTLYRIMLVACILGLMFVSGYKVIDLEERIVAPVQEFFHEEGAIAARQQINLFRYEAIAARPLLGYGFIDEKSALGRELADSAISRHDQTYGTVDDGYVDMRVRFGIVGAAVLLIGWVVFLVRTYRRRPLERGRRREVAAMVAFLASYLLISFTWSVLTYEFGLFSASVAMCLASNHRTDVQIGSAPADSAKTAEADT